MLLLNILSFLLKLHLDWERRLQQKLMVGGQQTIYSASFDSVTDQQDYDLQSIVSSAAGTDSTMPFYNKVGNKRIKIRQVYYVTPRQMWRFYGYYGGLNVTGDGHNYGQYSDDSHISSNTCLAK
jgi:hypothetical protein